MPQLDDKCICGDIFRAIGYSGGASGAIFLSYRGHRGHAATKQSTIDQRSAATTCQRIATRRRRGWGRFKLSVSAKST